MTTRLFVYNETVIHYQSPGAEISACAINDSDPNRCLTTYMHNVTCVSCISTLQELLKPPPPVEVSWIEMFIEQHKNKPFDYEKALTEVIGNWKYDD